VTRTSPARGTAFGNAAPQRSARKASPLAEQLGLVTSGRGAAAGCLRAGVGRLFLQLEELRKERLGVEEETPERKAQPAAERRRQAREAAGPPPTSRAPEPSRGAGRGRGTAVPVRERPGSAPGAPREPQAFTPSPAGRRDRPGAPSGSLRHSPALKRWGPVPDTETRPEGDE